MRGRKAFDIKGADKVIVSIMRRGPKSIQKRGFVSDAEKSAHFLMMSFIRAINLLRSKRFLIIA